MRILRSLVLCALVAWLGWGSECPGQVVDERRIERALRQALPPEQFRAAGELAERALLDVGGYHTFSALTLDDSGNNSRRLFQYDTTLYGRASLDGAHDAFVRARFRYRDFSPGDSFDGRGDSWAEPFLDRYWYEFDLRRHMAAYQGTDLGWDFNVRVGRQFVDWGTGLALSEQLYAARPTLFLDGWTIEGLAGVTPGDESIVDFDYSRQGYNSDTKRGYFGGLVRHTLPWGQEVYAYGLRMEDFNDEFDEARFGTAEPVNFRYEATYIGGGFSGSAWGRLVYEGEVVWQLGTSQSDPLRGPQTEEDIRAVAARGQLTYLFLDAGQTQAQFEGIVASGDADRQLPSTTVGGNLSGTVDRSFNSLGFANTGLAFAPTLSNLVTGRAGISTFPFADDPTFRRLQAGVDGMVFFKYNRDAQIDEPTKNESFLGSEVDLFVNYRILSDLSVSLRYGVFIPGEAITGDRELRHFVLGAITISF